MGISNFAISDEVSEKIKSYRKYSKTQTIEKCFQTCFHYKSDLTENNFIMIKFLFSGPWTLFGKFKFSDETRP